MRRRAVWLRAGLIVGTATASLLTGVANADPGDLDQTFGGDGIVEMDAPLGARKVALAPGNGLWVAGLVSVGGEQVDHHEYAASITRLKQSGNPDLTFGDAGELVWAFSDDPLAPATNLRDVAALPGGGVQISGEWCLSCVEDGRSFVARFDASGSPDLGFGENGVIAAPQNAFRMTSLGHDASLHACDLYSGDRHRVIVRRYLPDGQPDLAFSGDGRARVRIPGPSGYRDLRACGATADDGTLVATMDGTSRGSLRVKKLTSAGRVDVEYGDDGMTTASDIRAESAVVSADGSAWFAGVKINRNGPPRVLGLTPDGERDTTFGGTDGIGVLDLPELHRARDAHLAVRSDGSVAVTGTLPSESGERLPYLAMLTAQGEVDTSFGDGGLVSGYADLLVPFDILIDTDDRIVTANESVVIRFQA